MQQRTILVVDNEIDIQTLLSIFLKSQGHIVYCASDGQEALDIMPRICPDIILMDIQMPRKNGIEAVRELRADPRFANTPTIALTAHVRDFLPHDITLAGFDRTLVKPINFDELQALISN